MTTDRDDLLARALTRRAFLRGAFALGAGGAALYAIGCTDDAGDDGGDGTPPSGATPGGTAAASDITPVLLMSEFVAGRDNRFAVGLIRGGKLVKDAAVHLRFFTLGEDGTTGTLRGEGDAEFVELNIEGAHEHDASSEEAQFDDAVSFYLVKAPFDVAGRWAVEVAVTPQDGAPAQIQTAFDVRETPRVPALGKVPPASTNDTAATNPNTESLCSRSPACDLHDLVIADVLGKGRPLVVQFSTPAFCETRFCGPVLEVLLSEVPNYRDRVDFIHIEVWQDFQLRQQREAVRQWNLPTEPFTFFMNRDGEVVGWLEAIFTEEELRSFLDQLVAL